MKVQSKCQVESSGFLPATKIKYIVFCVSILHLLKITSQTILKTGRVPTLQAFSFHYSPPLYTALAQSLLCLIDIAKLQSCDSQHVPYYILSVHVWKAGGKGKF